MSTLTSERLKFPTATIREHRLRLFQPTRRPQRLEHIEMKTSFGVATVSGRLGQSHADLLDGICYFAELKADLEDGRIKLLVDPAKVRRAIRLGGQQMERLARELREATIQIKEPADFAGIGGLIDHIDTACRADGTPITRHNPLTGAERVLWRVEIGKLFSRLVQKDIWVGYDPAPIARMRHGVTQAVARHVLTHQREPNGGWTLDGLIRAVAGTVGEQALKDRRRELRADADALVAMGIEIDADDRVHRQASKVEQTPDSMGQTRAPVEQTPDRVEQMPDRVEQMPGEWSKRPTLAVP